MNISLRTFACSPYHVVKNAVTESLTPLQQKVAWIALAVIAFVCVGVFVFRRYPFKGNPIPSGVISKKEAQEGVLLTPPVVPPAVQPPSPISSASVTPNILPSSKTVRSEVAELASFLAPGLNKDATDKGKMSIPERLEKNTVRALEAQNKERRESGRRFDINKFDPKYRVEINRVFDSFDQPWCGVASAQSYKHPQEDAHILVPNFEIEGVTGGAQLFGVFDGHGGTGASTFVRENILLCFQTALQEVKKTEGEGITDAVVWKTLKFCCILLQATYNGPNDGTTAVIALTLNEKVWIANVGDSRAILVKENGETVQASEDAKPNIERYRKQIEKLHGKVGGRFIIGSSGFLAVARSIGDRRFPGVSCLPKITCYSLNDFRDGYLVLASDGLYDVATTDAVGKAVHGLRWSPDLIAERLVRAAIAHQSSDDVTVLVVKLPATP